MKQKAPKVKHDAALLSELDVVPSSSTKEATPSSERTAFEVVPFDSKIKKNTKMKMLLNTIKAKKKVDNFVAAVVENRNEQPEDSSKKPEKLQPKFMQISNFYKKQLTDNIIEYEKENPVGFFFTSPCKKLTPTPTQKEPVKQKENYTMNNPFGNNRKRNPEKAKKEELDTIKNRMTGWGSNSSKWVDFNVEKVMPCRCVNCELERFEKRFNAKKVKVIMLVDYDSWGGEDLCLDVQKLKNIGITEEELSQMYLWCFYNGYIYEKGMKKEQAKEVFDCFNFIVDDEHSASEESKQVLRNNKEQRKQFANTILGTFDRDGNLQMSQSNLQPQSADLAILTCLEHLVNKFSSKGQPKICVITRDQELSNTAKRFNSDLVSTPFGKVNYVFKQVKKLL